MDLSTKYLGLALKSPLIASASPLTGNIDTLRALESFLDEWPGALVVASHDRIFLDRTVDHVLAIDDSGDLRRVPGGVQGWLASRASGPSSTPSGSAAAPSARRAPRGDGPEARSASRYTIGRRLRDTEQAIAKVQRRVDRLHDDLAAADGHEQLAALGAELAAAQGELSVLEDRWLELAEQMPS